MPNEGAIVIVKVDSAPVSTKKKSTLQLACNRNVKQRKKSKSRKN
jgi:hypothetical protein